MLRFNDQDLEDGVDYFCVFKGQVYYLTARFEVDVELFKFYYEGTQGSVEEKFYAFECDLIYQYQ